MTDTIVNVVELEGGAISDDRRMVELWVKADDGSTLRLRGTREVMDAMSLALGSLVAKLGQHSLHSALPGETVVTRPIEAKSCMVGRSHDGRVAIRFEGSLTAPTIVMHRTLANSLYTDLEREIITPTVPSAKT